MILLDKKYQYLLNSCWQEKPHGRHKSGYVFVYTGELKYGRKLHRVIMKFSLKRKLLISEHVDHIDGNTLNNKRKNLRIVSRSQNMANQVKKSKGTSFLKNRKLWIAYISFNRKRIVLGKFKTREEAVMEYNKASRKIHGKYGKQSFL